MSFPASSRTVGVGFASTDDVFGENGGSGRHVAECGSACHGRPIRMPMRYSGGRHNPGDLPPASPHSIPMPANLVISLPDWPRSLRSLPVPRLLLWEPICSSPAASTQLPLRDAHAADRDSGYTRRTSESPGAPSSWSTACVHHSVIGADSVAQLSPPLLHYRQLQDRRSDPARWSSPMICDPKTPAYFVIK